MHRSPRSFPRLERLEQRETPAVNVTVLGSGVFVRGIPNGDLLVEGVGAATSFQFRIIDDGNVIGTYQLGGNLFIQTPSRPGRLEIDLNNRRIGGNVFLDLGNGSTGDPAESEIDIYDSTATTGPNAVGGQIYGNLTILKGNGQETVRVGAEATNVPVPVVNLLPITVRGTLTAAARPNTPFVSDTFLLGTASVVRGNVSISLYDDVSLGLQDGGMATPTTVGGNVNVTSFGPTQGLTANFYGVAARNLTVNGATSTPGFNSFTLAPTDDDVDTVIRGNVVATLGPALDANLFNILASQAIPPGTGTTRIFGNLTLNSSNSIVGTGNDFVRLDGRVYQSARINLGGGDNDFSFGATGYVGGSLYYTALHGVNNFGTNGTLPNVFAGTLVQNLVLTLGNGDNEISLQSGVGGQFRLRAGSGDNTVDLLPTVPTLYNLDLRFGNGDNTVNLNSDDQVSGLVLGGTGSNFLVQNGATFVPPFSYPNFTLI